MTWPRPAFILTFVSLMSFALPPWAQASPPAPVDKSQLLTSSDQIPEGLAKSDWSSIRAAYEAGRHAFQPVEGGWKARNPGQEWTTTFDHRGFVAVPKNGAWQWGLELKSYGFGTRQQEISGTPAVKAGGMRLSYEWDANLQEWFVNDPRGLEHGFTVKARPAAARSQGDHPLTFTIATRGTLRPSVTADARGVLFQDDAGATVLNYTGLKVWDADGKILSSRFEASGETDIRLLVEEQGARYPLTIDPIARQAFLKSANNGSQTNDYFGTSVAVSGDTVVVGAQQENGGSTGVDGAADEGASNSGAAYVFVRNGATWSQQAYLKAGNAGAGDYFGYSVAVSGDTVVVGAFLEDSKTTGTNSTPNESSSDSGAAYVFVRSGTTWTQQSYLKAGNTGQEDHFGVSVAVSGDTVVVGARNEDSGGTGVNATPDENSNNSGAAYVFVRSGGDWSQQAWFKASNPGARDLFGGAVAVSGDTVVVGASEEDGSASGVDGTPNDSALESGAAYVYSRSGTTWSQQAYLKASNTGVGDFFGCSVAVSDGTAVVGAYAENSSSTGVNGPSNESATDSGAAYVFIRSGTAWSQQAFLKASNTGKTDYFGYSVAVSGDTVAIGSRLEDSENTGAGGTPNETALDSGAAYVFTRSGAAWTQQIYLKAGKAGAGDRFGTSVAVSGGTLVVGANEEDSSAMGVNGTYNRSAVESGAAYVFSRSGTVWSQQAYLKESNNPQGMGIGDRFGYSVAVSGETVVVGAIGESSSTTGVNSAPDENASSSGAAYVFVRNGATWSQQAYLKASNTGRDDVFGTSVGISGDTVIVGAFDESSSSTGVNSTPNENAERAGAAYVFTRSGTVWSQQAYLKASNTGREDYFGISVAVSGNTVVVGAHGEDAAQAGIDYNYGAAYVFTRNGSTWSEQAILRAALRRENDDFGEAVAISADTVVVGATGEESPTTGVNSTPGAYSNHAGAAYVFVRNGTIWSQQAYLKAHNTGADDYFGRAVAISGDTVVVGADLEDSATTGVNSTPDENSYHSGAAYVFARSGTTWSQEAYLKAGDTAERQNFGNSVAVAGQTVVVGATGTDAAYVFSRGGTGWSQRASLNTGAGDSFGYSVAASGDTVVVGAIYEDSSTTGVNSTPNESASNSGAVYIYSDLLDPTVTGASPSAGGIGGGTSVTLTGTNFIGVTAVTFGGISAAGFTVNSATSITATTPPHVVGPVNVAVTTPDGTGTGTGLFTYATPDIAVSQAGPLTDGVGSVDFGPVAVGVTLERTFTITNPGATDLNSLAITKGGADAADFTIGALTGTSIPAGAGTATFTVTFAPGSNGTKNAVLHIASNVTGEKNPFDLVLSGIGNPPSSDIETISPILSILPGGHVGIAFQGAPGTSYEIQRSVNLTNWFFLAQVTAAPDGSVSHIDESPPQGKAFYRIPKP